MWFAIVAMVISAVSAFKQGQDAKKANKIATQNARADIEAARKKSEFDQERARQAGARLLGAQRAKFAAHGIELLGSPEEIFAETAAEIELEVLGIRFGFEVEEARIEGNIALGKFEAKAAEESGFLGLTSQFAGGANNLNNQGAFDEQTTTTSSAQFAPTGSP